MWHRPAKCEDPAYISAVRQLTKQTIPCLEMTLGTHWHLFAVYPCNTRVGWQVGVGGPPGWHEHHQGITPLTSLRSIFKRKSQITCQRFWTWRPLPSSRPPGKNRPPKKSNNTTVTHIFFAGRDEDLYNKGRNPWNALILAYLFLKTRTHQMKHAVLRRLGGIRKGQPSWWVPTPTFDFNASCQSPLGIPQWDAVLHSSWLNTGVPHYMPYANMLSVEVSRRCTCMSCSEVNVSRCHGVFGFKPTWSRRCETRRFWGVKMLEVTLIRRCLILIRCLPLRLSCLPGICFQI